MDNEKKQIARDLFFQAGMNKTQIANILKISRRTITYWVKEGDWNRLKDSANHLPALVAEKCYHLLGNLADTYLSELRVTNPISPKEIDGLHKLTLTINKLKNRSTVNETMEMLGFFLEGLRKKNPKLAEELEPYIEEYIRYRAGIYTAHVRPDSFTGSCGRLPWVKEDPTEFQLDVREDYFNDPRTAEFYEKMGEPFPSEEEITTLPHIYNERKAAREKAEKEAEELRDLEEALTEQENPTSSATETPVTEQPQSITIPPTNTRDNNTSEITYITSLSQLSSSLDNTRIPITTDASGYNPARNDSDSDNSSISGPVLGEDREEASDEDTFDNLTMGLLSNNPALQEFINLMSNP